MGDTSQLISALRVVADEISKFREEVQAARREINGLAKAIAYHGQTKPSKMAASPEQAQAKWLKEAAVRASQKLFTG